MNFYSDKIIKQLKNNNEKIDEFKLDTKNILTKYSSNKINNGYTNNLLKYDKNIIAFYCIDNEFYIDNCPSILIYNKCNDKTKNEINYYILFACTKNTFRNQGYASKLLDGLMERIKKENKKKDKTIKVILSSLEESVIFYENCGFKWIKESTIKDYKILYKYEKFDETKEYFILEKIIQ